MRNRTATSCLCALAVVASLLAGCQSMGDRRRNPRLTAGGDRPTRVTAAEQADAQIALGRVAEQQGDFEQAAIAYRGALDHDKKRADAYQRLAVLHDKKGKFRESAALYQQALEAAPGNPDLFCDMGYSLSLQRRWVEAEMNLRQAIALDPEHRRAHNNLGLVLAHNGRPTDALAEFRKAGCDEAQAHENVAFVLTTERRWEESRAQYQLALRARPASGSARSRLKELDALVARVDPPRRDAAPADRNLVTASASAPLPPARSAPAAVRPVPPKAAATSPKTPSASPAAVAGGARPAAPAPVARRVAAVAQTPTVKTPGVADRETTAGGSQPPSVAAPK